MPPRVIYLFGVDGSGKSTLARELVQALAHRGIPARCLWFRFNHWLSRLVNALGHLLGLAFYVRYPDGTRVGYHHYYKCRGLSLAYTASTVLDTFLAVQLRLRPLLRAGREVLILDRFIYDILVDLQVDTGNSRLWESWPGRLLRKLPPARILALYVATDREIIAQRRPDTCWDETFARRCDLYEQLNRGYAWGKEVKNDGPVGAALAAILEMMEAP